MLNQTKKSSIYLKLRTKRTPTKKPEFIVKFNGVEQSYTSALDMTYCYQMDAKFGPNCLTVELLNKEPGDTEADTAGNIIHDLAVELDELYIDKFPVTSYIKQQAIYVSRLGTREYTHGFMHMNGVLTLDFLCPGFYYIKKHKIIANV
jgi:hypothetical protein